MLPFDPGPLQLLVIELDAWRDRLDFRGPLPRTWDGRLRRDLEVEAVAASTSMEGVPVTVDEVRRILVGDRPSEVSEEDAALVTGYREAMGMVLRRADDPGFAWSPELWNSVHDRVLGGRYSAGAGRLRTGAAWVVDRATGAQIFDPPDEDAVPSLVDQMAQGAERGFGHPSITAAWVHVATAAIHPFRDGNGRTARILASLAMYRGGLKRPEFTSLEEWWGRHLREYYDAFSCLGKGFDADSDVGPFITAHVEAQLHQVRALDLRWRSERTIWQAIEQVVEDAGMQERVTNALWDAFFGRTVTPRAYRILTDVSVPTVTKDLATGVSGAFLTSEGAGRSRTYVAGPRLHGQVAGALGIVVSEDPGQARAEIVSHATDIALKASG